MWHSFLAGWAWSLATWGPSVPVLDCQCSCKCEVSPCPESSWIWEVAKGLGWIAVGFILQLVNIIPWLISLLGSILGGRAPLSLNVGGLEDKTHENPVGVAERARDQIQQLRLRSNRHGSS